VTRILALPLLAGCSSPVAPADSTGGGAGTDSGDRGDSEADTGSSADTDTDGEASLSFSSPGSTAENPVTFTVATTGEVASVEYVADGEWSLGSSTDSGRGFPVTYTFSTLGSRSIEAIATDGEGVEVASAMLEVVVSNPGADFDGMGAWLWYIEGTGYSHDELAARLVDLGFRRVLVKVADGEPSCSSWPELCDASVPATYQAAGLEAWAWSYNYPGDAASQAEALSRAAETGYDGYVLDIETEFDGASSSLESLVSAFAGARDDAVADGSASNSFVLAATTWGNPADHDMRVDIIDSYVDLHMPQTYVEAWGSSYMANAAYWVEVGTCEYRDLGATKPVRHVVSTETNEITAGEVAEFITASGPGSSAWRVPGEGTPMSIWSTWEAVDWGMTRFGDEPDCR